jgi:hypothetical protein
MNAVDPYNFVVCSHLGGKMYVHVFMRPDQTKTQTLDPNMARVDRPLELPPSSREWNSLLKYNWLGLIIVSP